MRSNGAIFLVLITFLCVLTLSGAAQDMPSEGLFQNALALSNKNCEALRRNEACYGHALLSAAPHPGVSTFNFDSEGDRVRLGAAQSFKLSGLDRDAGTWGIVLMRLRANLPSSQPENVTLVAFGDVELRNAVRPQTQARIQVRTRENVNVRFTASLQARVIGTLEADQTVTALERLEDSSWIRVQMPNSDQTGWVFAELMTFIDDVSLLNVSPPHSTYFEPMQAFYFRSGSDDPEFTSVPASGLLIQTPEGVGEVQLLINEINIQMGSTVFFQAQPDGMMSISTLEGHANISVGDVEQTAFDGTTVSVPLDADLKPAGEPAAPKPYDENKMKNLPLNSLEREITVQAARTEAEITQLIEEKQAAEAAQGSDPLESPTDVPDAEATAEITPEVVPTAEVTAETTPEVVAPATTTPEATLSEEATPEVAPTEEGTSEVVPAEPTESQEETGGADAAALPVEESTSEPVPAGPTESSEESASGADATALPGEEATSDPVPG
jgi:hypothetical protein